MKIVKVIFDNEEVLEVGEIKTLEQFKEEFPEESSWYLKRKHSNQFLSFEDDILGNLNQDNIEDYAKNNFDLVEQEDNDEKNIEDFSDDELLEEISVRKLLGLRRTIITQDFLYRFARIVDAENSILLESVLNEFERKLNL